MDLSAIVPKQELCSASSSLGEILHIVLPQLYRLFVPSAMFDFWLESFRLWNIVTVICNLLHAWELLKAFSSTSEYIYMSLVLGVII